MRVCCLAAVKAAVSTDGLTPKIKDKKNSKIYV